MIKKIAVHGSFNAIAEIKNLSETTVFVADRRDLVDAVADIEKRYG